MLPFLTSSKRSNTSARLGSSESTNHIGGVEGYDSCGNKEKLHFSKTCRPLPLLSFTQKELVPAQKATSNHKNDLVSAFAVTVYAASDE